MATVFLASSCNDCWDPVCMHDLCPNETGLALAVGAGSDSPITFERNLGQADPNYEFVAHTGRTTLLLNSHEAAVEVRASRKSKPATLRSTLVGARASRGEVMEPLTQRTNYLLGNDPSRWITDVPNFQRVRFAGIYPGVDLVYYGHGSELEHDFVVAPGTDTNTIRMQFTGAENIRVALDGGLEVDNSGATMTWRRPVLYQLVDGKRRGIEGRYRLDRDGSVGFEVGAYDIRRPLTIDPVLAYASFYGAGDSESAARVAVDAGGNAYITGGTGDAAFPVTAGAPKGQGNSAYLGDAMIVKLAADGKSVLYNTHLGGQNTDIGLGIALDSTGNVYITGATNSTDFPVTSGVFQAVAPRNTGTNGGSCFVTKLNAAGNALIYSTYLGGSGYQMCTGVAVDSAGNAYLTGATSSPDFPTQSAYQSAFHGSASVFTMDAFVTKLSPDGKSLIYSTSVGGTKNDGALAIAADSTGNAYITGGTLSTDFPITSGVLQSTFAGSGGQPFSDFATGDAFVMKLDSGGRPIYSTYLGGSKDDIGIGIAIDSSGNAYVAGSTMSTNFPLKSPFQSAYKGQGGEKNVPSGDGFVAKINPQGSALVYASYLGGAGDDRASGIAVDANGNAFVTGNTLSPDFPVSSDAQKAKYGGGGLDLYRTGDAFYAQIAPVGTLAYATYVGGSGTDWGVGVAVDSQGGVTISGGTNSPDFATTTGAAQARFGGALPDLVPAGDAFIMKFGAVPALSVAAVANAASYASGSVSPGEIVILRGTGIGPDTLTGLAFDAAGKVATKVAGTQVLFDNVPAPIVYVWTTQTAVVVPYGVASRSQTSIVVDVNGKQSAPVVVPVAAAVPGLFSADSSGSGQGALLNQNGSYNSPQNPAAKGSIIALYGTGEGQTNPAGVDGSVANSVFPKPVLAVRAFIGTTPIDALAYAGAAPSSIAGLFQVNVQIPCDAPTGNVPVALQIGTSRTQAGLTVAVRPATAADANSCGVQ